LNESKTDIDVLRAVFASRVSLAKRTEDEAAAAARVEHGKALKWVESNAPATKEGTFNWFCDYFDLDASAVRRAIREKK
jgi:hypothetical protein